MKLRINYIEKECINKCITLSDTLSFRIAQESAKATRIQMIKNGYQKMLVKLKSIRKLFAHLPYAVQELQEYRRPIGIRVMIVTVSDTLRRHNMLKILDSKM